MSEGLLSVGVDVGTTTTQLVVSRIAVENRAAGFAVPELEITGRSVLYRSPIHFTPLIRGELVDGDGIRAIVAKEYQKAGVERQKVDTGAIIITGETSRKENAASVKVMERCGFMKIFEGVGDYQGEKREICKFVYKR